MKLKPEAEYSPEVQSLIDRRETEELSPEENIEIGKELYGLKLREEAETPGLRVRVERDSPHMDAMYKDVRVDPEGLFDYMNELGMEDDEVRKTYFDFLAFREESDVGRMFERRVLRISLRTPFERAELNTKAKVKEQAREIVRSTKVEVTDDWRSSQFKHEFGRNVQGEVSRELAQTAFIAVEKAADSRLYQLNRRMKLGYKAALLGLISISSVGRGMEHGIIYGTANFMAQAGTFIMLGAFTQMMSKRSVNYKGLLPLTRASIAYANQALMDPRQARRLRDIVEVKPNYTSETK